MTYYLTYILWFFVGFLGIGLVKKGHITQTWTQIMVFFIAIFLVVHAVGQLLKGPEIIDSEDEHE